MVERENNIKEEPWDYWFVVITNPLHVGTKGVSQIYHLSFEDNKVLKIINWIC